MSLMNLAGRFCQDHHVGMSMLGKEQREWLLSGMENSDADFIFVVSSFNFMVPHVGGGAVRADNKGDVWTVFIDERESLIQRMGQAR